MTSEGLRLEKHVDRDESITPQTGRRLDRTIIVLLVIALGYFIWQSLKSPVPEEDVATDAGEPSIAVLPFTNMSSDAEQEYFSDGLTEELLNLLAKIPELKVTSRTSAFFFALPAGTAHDQSAHLRVAAAGRAAHQPGSRDRPRLHAGLGA